MQYLLTEAEYKELKDKDNGYTEILMDHLRAKVLSLANFTCPHDSMKDGYCDFCPLGGPLNNWEHRDMCKKSKNYSK
jgi:hypothetical protein